MSEATVVDEYPAYTQVWHCEAPDMGATYRVLREHWDYGDNQPTVRHIYEIQR